MTTCCCCCCCCCAGGARVDAKGAGAGAKSTYCTGVAGPVNLVSSTLTVSYGEYEEEEDDEREEEDDEYDEDCCCDEDDVCCCGAGAVLVDREELGE